MQDDSISLFDSPTDRSEFPGQAVTTRGNREGASLPSGPLAVRLRPRDLKEVIGQDHLLAEGAPLRRLVEGSGSSSIILYGPPGTGKTTIASLISGATGRRFEALSALNSGVKEVRAVIENARMRAARGEQTILFIDEVHRFSKTQQDALLNAVENGVVFLVAATTENPSFSIVSPLLSRSLVLELNSLSTQDIKVLINRALDDKRGYGGTLSIEPVALDQLARISGGDARRALTYLEAAASTLDDSEVITVDALSRSINEASVQYDRDGDQHYDVISAFIKSVRGSDVDAALHYLARMIEAGEDPRFIARRLIILASEDIGMADPTALPLAVAAAQAVQLIGFPEGRLTLAQATIHLATAPKSNSVIKAIDSAAKDIRQGYIGSVPPHLRDKHYKGAKERGIGANYRYPHDDPGGVVQQQYPPDEVLDRQYYVPSTHGIEQEIGRRVSKLRRIVRGAQTNFDPKDG